MTGNPSPFVTHSELAAVRRELQADLREELRQLSRDIRNELREMNVHASTRKQWAVTTLIACASVVASLVSTWR